MNMTRPRLVSVLALVCLALFTATLASAAKKGKGSTTPLTATWSNPVAVGVHDDGNPVYDHGTSGVQCYFGVNQKDANLVTYNTPRKLRFFFDSSSTAWQNSGLAQDFLAEVDLFGVNYFGPYPSMGVGTTAQVQMDLEFKVGKLTYELDYPSLAAMRLSETEWLITSDPGDIPGNPGFTASDLASLNVIRRRSQEQFGAVNMPIRFVVVMK
jgi:hypothetical protein